ncbi:MAG: hypothetical protein CL526_09050 [Aequorivita sp.]|nr:hypothetical protein [Aequorivita sp.]|tara:strand:- start:122425 stop:122667 length:243 start_codon:yes stop_codon:yes gene_type:complete
MNTFETINTEYLTPSRTIETIVISKDRLSRVLFVYNYDGNSFRVFETIREIILFFQDRIESSYHYDTEFELDYFLSKFKI